MVDRENVINELVEHIESALAVDSDYVDCVRTDLLQTVVGLLKEQQEEHKRMISWLSKFCRHIDNGDKWLTDEENLKFFREKMKQQFGWSDT